MTNENIQQLSQIEQMLSQLVGQKQQFQRQLFEVDSALKEVSGVEEGYEIIGTVMVKKNAEDLSASLSEKKKMLDARVSSLEKQETKLKEQAKTLQEDIIKNMSKEK